MQIFNEYVFALWGIAIIIATVVIQGLVAGAIKAKQPNAIPGKVDETLSHSSIVFRTYRTHLNSLENLSPMLGTSFLAILAGASALWTGILIWTFAISRIVHMALYYAIATEQNPSPRSYFFLIGLIANIALLLLAAFSLG